MRNSDPEISPVTDAEIQRYEFRSIRNLLYWILIILAANLLVSFYTADFVHQLQTVI